MIFYVNSVYRIHVEVMVKVHIITITIQLFHLRKHYVICCRLQYKYTKLVESTSGKDSELPAAETCALDEGEEDEQFDAVEFKQKGSKLFRKLKQPSKKTKVTAVACLTITVSPHRLVLIIDSVCLTVMSLFEI